MDEQIRSRAYRILEKLKQDQKLSKYIDHTLSLPEPYQGNGEIRLIVLGQDPTVKNPDNRKNIKMVLNLDKKGVLKNYLSDICGSLSIDLQKNLYATNIYKNFFIQPPTTIDDIDIFSEFLDDWLPLLKDELAPFEQIPILSLGEPILAPLIKGDIPKKVREYWGYIDSSNKCNPNLFRYIQPDENKLGRMIFPFPHQPSRGKEFYRTNLDDYTQYVKKAVFKNG